MRTGKQNTDGPPQYAQGAEVENKMRSSLEYGNQQPTIILVQQPQAMVQPQVQNVTTQQTPTTREHVNTSMAMNNNLSYFKPRQDTGSYAENMKPWETDGQNYAFAACTEFVEEFQEKKKQSGVKTLLNSTTRKIHTVYHKANSHRLIIKRKDGTSTLAKAKNNPMTKWAVGVFLLGVILAVLGAFSMVYLIVAGGIIVVISFMLCLCFQKKKSLQQNQEIVTQSIPIEAIFYVERYVEQTEESEQCCCNTKELNVNYSDISIGYNRSNLSAKLEGGHGARNTEDFFTIKLAANQAYNLHQYINAMLDGSHPQTNNGNVVGAVVANSNVLPRASGATPRASLYRE